MSLILDLIPFDKLNTIVKYNVIDSLETIGNIGIDIGQNIEQNVTVFNSYMNDLIVYIVFKWTYISVIMASFSICFIIGLLVSLLDNEIKNTDKMILNDNDKNKNRAKYKNNTTIVCNNGIENMNNQNKVKYPTGLYCESIRELVSKNNEIITNISNGNDFWVLLRVVMKNPVSLKRSKYELHSNHIGNRRNRVFKSRDMYMTFKMKYFSGNNSTNINKYNDYKVSIANSIIRCMNYWNHISPEQYKTCDFVVVAIGNKSNQNNPREFYDGLININYELFNFKDIVINLDNKMRIGYTLMLPINEIYDIFMDVYNITIFESSKYLIDDNNYESWNNKSINELKF